MLPLLEFASDNKVHKLSEAVENISNKFKLSDEERAQMLPSGLQAIIVNRVGWAKTYLKKANLIEDPKRATFQITKRGLDLLNEKPGSINTKFLERYEEFVAFRQGKNNKILDDRNKNEIEETSVTPEESIEFGFKKLKESVSEEIISKIRAPRKTQKILIKSNA